MVPIPNPDPIELWALVFSLEDATRDYSNKLPEDPWFHLLSRNLLRRAFEAFRTFEKDYLPSDDGPSQGDCKARIRNLIDAVQQMGNAVFRKLFLSEDPYGQPVDGAPIAFGETKVLDRRLSTVGIALEKYRDLRIALKPHIAGLSEAHGLMVVLGMPEVERAWAAFNKSRSGIGQERFDKLDRNDLGAIFLMTKMAARCLQEIQKETARVEDSNRSPWLAIPGIVALKTADDPLSFWMELNHRFVEFYRPAAQEALASVAKATPDLPTRILTPPRTREQHADTWGFSNGRSASRVFQKVWPKNAGPGEVHPLPVDELFPLIKKSSKRFGGNIGTAEDLLKLYTRPLR